jgi:hypothetical protein
MAHVSSKKEILLRRAQKVLVGPNNIMQLAVIDMLTNKIILLLLSWAKRQSFFIRKTLDSVVSL